MGAITAITRPILLTPELFGLWNLLKTIPEYTSYAHLGACESARYAIPRNQVRGRDEDNAAIERTLFLGSFILNLVPFLGLVVYALAWEHQPVEFWGLLAVAGIVLLRWAWEYQLTMLKAYQRFSVISLGNVIMPVINFLGLGLLLFFSIYGLYVSALASLAAVTVYYLTRMPLQSGPAPSLALYRNLVALGFPIMSLALVILLLRTADRFIIAGLLGAQELGYYSIAIMILNFAMNVPVATREIMEPRLMQALDGLGVQPFMDDYFFRPLLTTAFAMPLILGPVFYLAPLMVSLLLPRYIPGIETTGIIAVGGYFLALVYITRGIVVARRRQAWAAGLGLVAATLNVGLSLGLVKAGLGIEGVAVSTVTALGVYYLMLHLLLIRLHGEAVRGWMPAGLILLVPLAVLLGPGLGLRQLLLGAGLGDAAVALVGLPLYYGSTWLAVTACRGRTPHLIEFTVRSLMRSLRTAGPSEAKKKAEEMDEEESDKKYKN